MIGRGLSRWRTIGTVGGSRRPGRLGIAPVCSGPGGKSLRELKPLRKPSPGLDEIVPICPLRGCLSSGSGQKCPLPLGIEARSHAGQGPFGRQRQSGGPVPPHPTFSPKEKEPRWPRYEPAGAPDRRESGLASASPPRESALSVVVREVWRPRFVAPRPIVLPLLWGAGVRGNGAHAVSTVPGVLCMTPSRPGCNS